MHVFADNVATKAPNTMSRDDDTQAPYQPQECRSVMRVREAYEEASQRMQEEPPDVTTAQAREQKALYILEAIGAGLEMVLQTRNPVIHKLQCQMAQQCAEELAAMLPEWHLRCQEMRELKERLEDEKTARQEAQAEYRRLYEQMVQIQQEEKVTQGNSSVENKFTMSTRSSNRSSHKPEQHKGTAASKPSTRPAACTIRRRFKTPQLRCPVCQQPTKKILAYRCSSCKEFWYRLIRRYVATGQLHTQCNHSHSEQNSKCAHCRRKRYEVIYSKFYPRKKLPIPSLIDSEDNDLREGEGCLPPGAISGGGREMTELASLRTSQNDAMVTSPS
ncbi:hypothetical protein GE061_007876 [Apolygus lucorum]|uniref:Uncharacterized protein n=1 Tax=Apolygus lucorum TaxID=248454 RepID=A0A8S9WPL7_APOLU|nr:hypothetical protein GE061_007876 [Apolygus lucorum]